MPNLLKSLPKEILKKEDSKFVYNVLNPLLFDKIKESSEDTTVSHTVSSLLQKDINYPGQFLSEFVLPYNINSREFNVYMTDGQENKKMEFFGDKSLIDEMDDLKEYIFFLFGVEGYDFLYEIIKRYYYISNEYSKNKELYEYNYRKYLETVDVRKKKVYKSTYEHFKKIFDEFDGLKSEFDFVISESLNYNSYSVNQMIDNYAREIGNHLDIKTFDNEIIFSKSQLFAYLEKYVTYDSSVDKHIFSGKNILSTQNYNVQNIFQLIAIFAMELSSIKTKYDEYLKILLDNGDGYALEKSEHKKLKNEKFANIKLGLENDNLTYFLNENKNQLEIYVYFSKDFRIDESTLVLNVNDLEIAPSIHSLNGNTSFGYTLYEYFDDTTKYYKITVHNYLVKDLFDAIVNYDILSIDLQFDAIKSSYYHPVSTNETMLETTGFLDNFVIYAKNEESGFFEVLNIPYKVKVSIDEKEERYVRIFDFEGIDSAAHTTLISQTDIVIGCYEYDYCYEPKLYVDFFKHNNNSVNFRYNTIVPYVLIDDVLGDELELDYFADIPLNEYSSNIYKNVIMYDGKTYRKLYDDINQMRVLNPYNESDYAHVGRISLSKYKERNHTNKNLITSTIEKIPFKNNLKYLDKFQYDSVRDMFIVMYRGIQQAVPLNEGLVRGLNFEQLSYNAPNRRLEYYGKEMCDEGFKFVDDGIYLKNPLSDQYDLIEFAPVEQINIGRKERMIFFDMYEMSHCFIINGIKYKINGLYIDSFVNAINSDNTVMFVESKYGIPRYKTQNGDIIDVDFSRPILIDETPLDNSIVYNADEKTLTFKCTTDDQYVMTLVDLETKRSKHRQVGMTAFSIFYAGNVLPENSNKSFFGRENIYGSMSIADNIYDIGRSGDVYNDLQHHNLLAEQMNLDVEDAAKFNSEQEPYLMFKSATASLKGLESYLRSSLKSISQEIGVSPVYLVQRNRFISEWAKVSTVLPKSFFAESSLKELVADLMETKLMNGNYDDLMDIFKNNEYENFSIDTNNIHNILIQYILRFFDNEYLLEEFTYYLIHEVWIGNNRKKILDYIKAHCDDATIRTVSAMTFQTNYEKEQLFYIFVEQLKQENNTIIESYIPLANYSDWTLYQENNHIKFDKPYRYEVIDISDFITMAVEWDKPLLMIRPLTEDGVFVKRDFRFLDISMVTNTQVTYLDSYNEYVENIKNKLNKPVDYLNETLDVLNELSLSDGFDILGINLVILRWIVERHIPTYMMSNEVEDVETFRDIIKMELMSAEHPNMIVSFNKIKETTVLGDLGVNVSEIYESITNGNMVSNDTVRLNVSSSTELEYLDKIKKPLEHYFDFLFYAERHDIITKVLALFTEDVIATSMIDLSFVVNIKNTRGDETFNIYENMINDIFDEFLPFHTVLDKIIFTIKIMESSSSEALSKELEANVEDTYLVDIVMDFMEKVRIQASDRISTTRALMFIPTEGLLLCGGHNDIPYDYDRTVKVAGHDIPPHMDDYETFAVDDEWYVVNRDRWRQRSEDLYTPPEFADYWWDCGINPAEMEQPIDTFVDEYFMIKTEFFDRDDRIESHFVDSIPSIDILYDIDEEPTIDVVEDYLINIDSKYKIKFFDMELLGHDEYGLDEAWGPQDQTTLIDMRENIRENILHDFYEKLNLQVLDSIWTDVVVIYDFGGIPGHDEFGIDEYYHQTPPHVMDREISTYTQDELWNTTIDFAITDMSDVSLINETLAISTVTDYRELILNTVVSEDVHVTIDIMTNRHFDTDGHFIRPGHDEFVYDEYYHNSADEDRVDNMTDIMMDDFMGEMKIDFGFMRMLPFDPYVDIINQKFYRADLPGSEFQRTRIKDSMLADVHISGKDIIRVGMMDFYTLDMIDESLRRKVYENIEDETFGGDWFTSSVDDSLINRHIHHDFRENIIAIDKYASVLSDADILEIFGERYGEIERDDLFKLELGDKFYADVKVKHPVERSMTKFDRDYLTSIKVEEENFVEFKYVDRRIDVRFSEMLKTYMVFNDRVSLGLTTTEKSLIEQIDNDVASTGILDKVDYGQQYDFVVDGMTTSISDVLIQAWSNKIHKDSMVVSVTETTDLKTSVNLEYEFGEERIFQPHAEYGHMGYTEESIERSVDSRVTDSLIQISTQSHFNETQVALYDGAMKDIHQYFGDYIDVVISDSLHTYVEIVKRPWIFPEFDEFGHNEYPHMYNGDDDEFDISTVVRESMKQFAYTSLYDSGALAILSDRIHFGQQFDIGVAEISVSMTDDLKVVDILTDLEEFVEADVNDFTHFEPHLSDPEINIVVNDRVWYGYKLREKWVNVDTSDTIEYSYADQDEKKIDHLPVSIRDWFLVEYTFIDDKPNINLSDSTAHSIIGTHPVDYASVALQDSLESHEFVDFNLFDSSRVYISDKLIVDSETGEDTYEEQIDADVIIKDSVGVGTLDVLRGYGEGKRFNEPLSIWTENRLFIEDLPSVAEIPKISVESDEWFNANIITKAFKDTLSVDTYERMKFGPVFRDKTNIQFSDRFGVHLSWLNDRFGVDTVPHSEKEMEYYNDAADRSVTTGLTDDIKIIDTHLTFNESLTILSSDQLIPQQPTIDVVALRSDLAGVSFTERMDVRLSWTDDRYGVDNVFGHDDEQQEYYNDAADRAFDVGTKDDIKIIDTSFEFYDRLNVLSTDGIVYDEDSIFEIEPNIDELSANISETLDVRLLWLDDKFGVDEKGHSEDQMEFINDSADRSFNADVIDTITNFNADIIFGDAVGVYTADKIVSESDSDTIVSISAPSDGIVIVGNDNLMYGVGLYDYVWDAKEWDKFGYDVPYEDWKGPIPHDDTPHDELEHSQQGDDLSQIVTGITDTLTLGFDYTFTDSLNISMADALNYSELHDVPTITDKLMVYTNDGISLDYYQHVTLVSRIITGITDSLTYHAEIAPFKDDLSLQLVERLSSSFKFRESTNSVLFDTLMSNDMETKWVNTRYGIDDEPHSESGMGFYGDVVDNSMELSSKDDIKLLDTHLIFVDSLDIMSDDKFTVTKELILEADMNHKDGIFIDGTERITSCDVGVYHYIWDVKQWDDFGYGVPYENWSGIIPFDQMDRDIDAMISTGISDTVIYGVDFLFKDTIGVYADDSKDITVWGYRSMFKDSAMVYTANRIKIDWDHSRDASDTVINFRNETMSVSYEFDDNVKTHKFFTLNNGISVEAINTYDKDTYQIIETLMKYKMYDSIYTDVNSNLLTSTLFKYDEELSLVTDYKTKIDLYKAEDDGSVTRSMTVIKDKTSAKIEMIFTDGIMTLVKDKLHATDAIKPNEYLD